MTAVASELTEFQFFQFRDAPLVHAMSGRRADAPAEGDIAYSPNTGAAQTAANRQTFFANMGLDLAALTLGKQVHGDRVVPVIDSDRGRGQPPDFDGFPDTDGLVTSETDVALGVIIGDCVPVLLYDPVKHVVGLVHAGWRGTVATIARRAVEIMKAGYGCRPRTILAGIGPSIGPCCYEVGDEVIDAWMANNIPYARHAVIQSGDRQHFDLWTANRYALMEAGLQRRNIEDAAICTRCEYERYFSRRAHVAGVSPKGSQMMVVQLRPRG